MTRAQSIEEIKKHNKNKNYNFNRFTDAQLYRMAQRFIKADELKNQKVDSIDVDEPDTEKAVCSECGTLLTDGGDCPVCDYGEEDLNEDIEKHDVLNPKLWNPDNTLKPEVKDKIITIVDTFLNDLKEDGVDFKLKDIKLVGSNCSYNYNKDSDLDIHLVMDTNTLNCPSDVYTLIYSAYRSLWNKNHNISFYGIPVEIFIETDDTEDLNKQATESLNEALIEKNITISELKKLVDNIHNKLKSAGTPAEKKIGGTYYGSTQLFSSQGNMLEILKQYTTPGSYYNPSVNYKNCYALKIGGAYDYNLYKEDLYKLFNVFDYRVIDGWSMYDQVITKDGYKVRLIDEFGTNFSVYGFDIFESMRESLNEANNQTALKSNGVYSVMNDAWIKEPVAEDIPDIDRTEFDKQFLEWENRYYKIKENPSIDTIEDFIEDIYELRKNSIRDEGEYGFGNLIFKECRALGYLDDLKTLKLDLENKELSLESLQEDTEKVKDGKWVNRGKEGTHGTFKTKKAADAQRKAIWVNWNK